MKVNISNININHCGPEGNEYEKLSESARNEIDGYIKYLLISNPEAIEYETQDHVLAKPPSLTKAAQEMKISERDVSDLLINSLEQHNVYSIRPMGEDGYQNLSNSHNRFKQPNIKGKTSESPVPGISGYIVIPQILGKNGYSSTNAETITKLKKDEEDILNAVKSSKEKDEILLSNLSTIANNVPSYESGKKEQEEYIKEYYKNHQYGMVLTDATYQGEDSKLQNTTLCYSEAQYNEIIKNTQDGSNLKVYYRTDQGVILDKEGKEQSNISVTPIQRIEYTEVEMEHTSGRCTIKSHPIKGDIDLMTISGYYTSSKIQCEESEKQSKQTWKDNEGLRHKDKSLLTTETSNYQNLKEKSIMNNIYDVEALAVAGLNQLKNPHIFHAAESSNKNAGPVQGNYPFIGCVTSRQGNNVNVAVYAGLAKGAIGVQKTLEHISNQAKYAGKKITTPINESYYADSNKNAAERQGWKTLNAKFQKALAHNDKQEKQNDIQNKRSFLKKGTGRAGGAMLAHNDKQEKQSLKNAVNQPSTVVNPVSEMLFGNDPRKQAKIIGQGMLSQQKKQNDIQNKRSFLKKGTGRGGGGLSK